MTAQSVEDLPTELGQQRIHMTVTFGDIKRKFKQGSTPASVLKHMAREFPPCGVLLHGGEEGLVVVSQEETLSQTEYVYQHPQIRPSHELNLELLNAVLKLQIGKEGQLVTYGSAVVFSKEGLSLTANHCLTAARVRSNSRSIRIGGYQAKILARNDVLDIACLKITNDDGSDFSFIRFDVGYRNMSGMKIHLISFPLMMDEFTDVVPTVTHGQVSNSSSNSQYILGDYASFPNSSGGAVVCNDKLVGIHVQATHEEEKGKDKAMESTSTRLKWLESSLNFKSALGISVGIGPVETFLLTSGIISQPRIPPSALCQSRNSEMVSIKQSAKKQKRTQPSSSQNTTMVTRQAAKKLRENNNNS